MGGKLPFNNPETSPEVADRIVMFLLCPSSKDFPLRSLVN